MRDPSLHIKESDLYRVLGEFIEGTGLDELVQEILKKSKPYFCTNRSLFATNQKLRKKAEQLSSSTKSDTDLLAQIIYAVRIKLKHVGVKKVNEDDRDWLQLKELTNICNQFCEQTTLEKREGYIKYIELGLSKLRSMRAYISKLISMYDSIIQDTIAIGELKGDMENKAKDIHDIYIAAIASRTGIWESYITQPSKMQCFLEASKLCDSLGCDYSTFIEAQFDALSFCNGIPLPEHLIGDKGKERLNKFLYKHNIQLEQLDNKTNWDNILGV